MNAISPALRDLRTSLAPVGTILRSWRALSWRHWAWALAIGALLGCLQFADQLPWSLRWKAGTLPTIVAWFVVYAVICLLAIAVVEYTEWRYDALPLRRYLLALAVAAVLCAALGGGQKNNLFGRALNPFADGPELQLPRRIRDGFIGPFRIYVGYDIQGWKPRYPYIHQGAAWTGVVTFTHGVLATLVYLRVRNARRTARSLADAEHARADAERRWLLSQLEATRARVEPAALFDTLRAIGDLYDRDPLSADARMDELIASLRAALQPSRDRGETTTPPSVDKARMAV